MSRVCFIFPNRRSGTFFLKHLSAALPEGETLLAPEVLGIDEFVERVSGLCPVSRIESVFTLYDVYRRLRGRNGFISNEEDLLDFDRFAPWGETVLSDFSEVEKYMVSAAELFRNVRDYRNIASNFLTEQQLEIIERYFGYRPAASDVERFWDTVGQEEIGNESALKDKFVELWRLLPELYEGLIADLDKEGLALPGTMFRRAAIRLEEMGSEALEWDHVVAVGFNMLSTSEARLFSALGASQSREGDALGAFFWDATGPVLGKAQSRESLRNPATAAMHRNLENFPPPVWGAAAMAVSAAEQMPPVLIEAAAPSNAAQAKIAGLTVAEWLGRGANEADTDHAIRDARTAVVIPDEGLLLPLLNSLPPDLPSLNLTMGHSMRFTSVSSFVYHLRRLQTRARRDSLGRPAYYHEDLRLFMSHPLMQVLAGSAQANAVNNDAAADHLRIVPLEWIARRSPEAASILKPLERHTTAAQTIAYLDEVLSTLYVALSGGEENPVLQNNLERMQVDRYRQALMQVLVPIEEHKVSMHFSSVFRLVDRLVSGETVTFQGEPLEGLQLMGLLETRAIDFDRIVILSMNDKVMPRRARRRTFIPESLRRGYGMPSSTQAEELYSYYFYRLISRAREVTMVYDARAGEGMRSGGKSRFLLQLEMLYAKGLVTKRDYAFMLESTKSEPQPVVKTDSIMERLEDYRSTDPERARNLSASAFTDYCHCQLLFFYKHVMGVGDYGERPDSIDPITQGNIVHRVMLDLYFPEGLQRKLLKYPRRLKKEDIEAMLADTEGLERVVKRALNREHFHLDRITDPESPGLDRELPPSMQMSVRFLVAMVRKILEYDLRQAPLMLLGGEVKGRIRWSPAPDIPEVNISYAFDRVDISGSRVRVADYKTGRPKVSASSMQALFDGEDSAHHDLQLLLYAGWLEKALPAEGLTGVKEGIALEILSPDALENEGGKMPEIKMPDCEGKLVVRHLESHLDAEEEFTEGAAEMLRGLFDKKREFLPPSDSSRCAHCRLGSLCGREA